jgi:hypothetical protein
LRRRRAGKARNANHAEAIQRNHCNGGEAARKDTPCASFHVNLLERSGLKSGVKRLRRNF